jgi:hypothetical protein
MTHRHGADAEEATGPSEGPVVLDIGGDFGAAVVRTGPELDGSEIEIRRLPAEWEGEHVAVRSRPTSGAAVYAAVFGHLREGTYELRRRRTQGDAAIHRIAVMGGRVVESSWPDSHGPS